MTSFATVSKKKIGDVLMEYIDDESDISDLELDTEDEESDDTDFDEEESE